MNKMFLTFFLAVSLACTVSCDDKDNTEKVVEKPEESTYANPVYSSDMPDPEIIKGRDGYFYIFATEDGTPTPIIRSKDLVSWTLVGAAFTEETRPSFEPNGGVWAPDINYINDQYVLYYSMSRWGGGETCGIGSAIGTNPEGPFKDKGKMLRSNEIGVHNSIDPFYIEEDGRNYLFWGSFFGIYYIELTDDGLGIKYEAEKQKIAGSAFEAVNIHKRDEYYYMFASIGSCCEGVNSTYKLVVARSKSLFGPYVNKEGRDMMDNGYEVVIASNDKFVGNGHCSEIVQDDAGKDWILYHGIDVEKPDGRILLLDQVEWVDEWPVVNDGSPSLSAERPYFE